MALDKDLLAEIAQGARLREGPAGVAALLRQLNREAPLATAELARRLGWPVPVTAAVRRELERAGLVERTAHGCALSSEGNRFARALGITGQHDPLCPHCAGRRIAVDRQRWQTLLTQLETVHQANPPVDTTLDQSHGTPETALLRALAMYREGALEGKALLILGDDDLVSVAVGLLARAMQTELVRQMVVVDVDERFLAQIAQAGRELGFPVETVAHDLRDPLPEALRATFDTVETDPPYTVAGLRLFLSRALEGLCPGSGQDLFLSFAPRDPAGQWALLSTCTELGLAPLSITPDFNRYVGAATLGHSGQFLHLRTTEQARPSVEGHYAGPLYTMDLRPAIRRYRCRDCGAEYAVGPTGAFPTVEVLKSRGCPQCGGKAFRAGKRHQPRGATDVSP
jgi:predicted methyltransferase/DNA-directed RNA polymerase subunit RPC12/RpoP